MLGHFRPVCVNRIGMLHPRERSAMVSPRMVGDRMRAPSVILAAALRSLDDGDLTRIAAELDIPHCTVMRAANGARGQPTPSAVHIKLCAYRGVDPITGDAMPPRYVHFDARLFAIALKMARLGRGQSIRSAAREIRLSYVTWSRIEADEARSFDSVLLVAHWAGLDIRNYVFDVSRETNGNKFADRVAA